MWSPFQVVLIAVCVVGVTMGVAAYCFIWEEHGAEQGRLETHRLSKQTRDDYDALLLKAHNTIATQRGLHEEPSNEALNANANAKTNANTNANVNAKANTNASVNANPNAIETATNDLQQMFNSGRHAGKVHIIVKNKEGTELKIGRPFTADFTLSFQPDAESGEDYFITGKRVDRYGQSTITEGYMCHNGHAYWKEKYVVSLARLVRDHTNPYRTYWDGPVMIDAEVVMLGQFNINNNTQRGQTTFLGVWSSQQVEVPSGKVETRSQVLFGPNIYPIVEVPVAVAVAGTGSEGLHAELVMS